MANMAARIFAAALEEREVRYSYMNEEESVIHVGWKIEGGKLDLNFAFSDDNEDVQIFGFHFVSDFIPPYLYNPMIRDIKSNGESLAYFREVCFSDFHQMSIHVYIREAGNVAVVDQSGGGIKAATHCCCNGKYSKNFSLHCHLSFLIRRAKKGETTGTVPASCNPFFLLWL